MPTKKAKQPKTITKDGLFISRAMRRAADVAAKSEAESNQLAADDAADTADQAAYTAKYPDQSDAEKAHNAERAQAQATADARKKYGLKPLTPPV